MLRNIVMKVAFCFIIIYYLQVQFLFYLYIYFWDVKWTTSAHSIELSTLLSTRGSFLLKKKRMLCSCCILYKCCITFVYFDVNAQGGVNTGLCYGGIYIKSLVPGGAAEQDGRIHTGVCYTAISELSWDLVHSSFPFSSVNCCENVLVWWMIREWW